jgi:DNA-binding NarL/FixJ family response regulator
MSLEILIVEDDDLHRQFLYDTMMESDLGDINVTQASNGEDAVDLLGQKTFASAVVDLQMPGKTGVDVARAIWGQSKSTPILFWSNYADEAYVRGIYRVAPEGANYGYLLKSSSSKRLKRTLSGVFLDGQTIIDRAVGEATNFKKTTELSAVEYEALIDIAIGLTDSAIAEYRGVSVRAVQSRLKSVYEKLGIAEVPATLDGTSAMNRRARAVALALMSRKINSKILDMAEKELVARGCGHLLA